MSIKTRLAAVVCAGFMAAAAVPAVSVNAGAVIVYGRAGQTSSLSGLKSILSYPQANGTDSTDYTLPVLTKSRTLKKYFQLKRGETLIIPAGKTLNITGGAELYGDICIEKGGQLKLSKYSVHLYGSIFCEGTLSVTEGTLNCYDGSMLYISEDGKFTAADRGITELDEGYELNGRIDILPGANAVCLGKTNIPSPYLESEPVAAVFRREEFDGAKQATEVITDSVRLNELLATPFNNGIDRYDGDFSDNYTVLFSGGAAVSYRAFGNTERGFDRVGGVNVQLIKAVLDSWHRPEALKYAENAFAESDVVVRAKYLSCAVTEDYVEYAFKALGRYRAKTEDVIKVRRDREWSDEYTQEFTEGEYFLPLNKKTGYYTLGGMAYIPLNGGAAECVCVNGEKVGLAAEYTVEYLAALASRPNTYPELAAESE